MLSSRAHERMRNVIDRYDLHREVPVDIARWALEDGWTIDITSRLEKLIGLAIVIDDLKCMAINGNVASDWQRLAVAHEWAHWIACHEDSIYMMQRLPTLNSRQEHEADVIAGQLLIPDWVLAEEATLQGVARRCDVPLELVHVRVGYRDISLPGSGECLVAPLAQG